MPWQCKKCQKQILDEHLTCPDCAAPKTSWTLVQDKTRGMVLQTRKFTCMRGEESDPLATSAEYDQATWQATKEVCVLPKVAVQDLAENNQLPAPCDVLQVRVFPRKHKDWTITLTPRFQQGKIEDRKYPQPNATLSKEGYFDARFVLVCGEGDLSQVQLQGVGIVDMTEETDEGFAPSLDVVAVKKKKKPLALEECAHLSPSSFLRLNLLDEAGDEVEDLPYEVELPAGGGTVKGRLDDSGSLEIACPAGSTCRVRFPDLPANSWVAASDEVIPATGVHALEAGPDLLHTLHVFIPELHVAIGVADKGNLTGATFRLWGTDGGSDVTRTLQDDRASSPELVELRFEVPDPTTTYTLEVDPTGDGSASWLVFEDIPYEDLVEEEEEEEETELEVTLWEVGPLGEDGEEPPDPDGDGSLPDDESSAHEDSDPDEVRRELAAMDAEMATLDEMEEAERERFLGWEGELDDEDEDVPSAAPRDGGR